VSWAIPICCSCHFISNRIGVGLAFLKVTMEIQARYALLTFAARSRRVAVKTTNLTKHRRAGLLSALDVVGGEVPICAACIEAWVLVSVTWCARKPLVLIRCSR